MSMRGTFPLQTTRRAHERPIEWFASPQEVREAAERDYILRKLDEAQGNITRTAELLGLERSNLYRRMKRLALCRGSHFDHRARYAQTSC
jgi:two-component system nitrogen regulation response regulator NtrX